MHTRTAAEARDVPPATNVPPDDVGMPALSAMHCNASDSAWLPCGSVPLGGERPGARHKKEVDSENDEKGNKSASNRTHHTHMGPEASSQDPPNIVHTLTTQSNKREVGLGAVGTKLPQARTVAGRSEKSNIARTRNKEQQNTTATEEE